MRVRVVLALVLAGCHASGPGDDARPARPVPSSSGWGEAAAAGSQGETTATPTQRGDKQALADLLRAASARAAGTPSPASTPGGDTRLPGTGDVDLDAPKTAAPPIASASAPRRLGAGNDVIERSARASLYWELTRRCKDEHEAILPPESVEVMFDVDEEGYLVTSTIAAIPKAQRFERAALCMRREVARSAYRAPPAARGVVTHIKLWVPSTD